MVTGGDDPRRTTNFITPLTLSTLSKKPVLVDYFIPEDGLNGITM